MKIDEAVSHYCVVKAKLLSSLIGYWRAAVEKLGIREAQHSERLIKSNFSLPLAIFCIEQ